jgi:hypothetical protein
MGNGFIVNIKNENDIFQEIKLFSSELPEGIVVQTIDKLYDFDSLKMSVKEKSCKGNSITTNYDETLKICIVNMGKELDILLNGRYEGPEILIDGNNNFIKVYCPPNSNFYIRLLAIQDDIIKSEI